MYIPAPLAEGIVWRAVAAVFTDPATAFRAFADGNAMLTEAEALHKAAAAKEDERQKALRRWENLIEQAADESDTGHAAAIRSKAATYHARANELEAEVNRLAGQAEAKIGEHDAARLHETRKADIAAVAKVAARKLAKLTTEQRAELVNIVLGDVKLKVQVIPAKVLKAEYTVQPVKGNRPRLAEHRKLAALVQRYQGAAADAADLAAAFGLDGAEGLAGRRAAALLLPTIQVAAVAFAPCARNHAGAGWRLSPVGGVDPARLLDGLAAFAKSL